MTAEHWVTASEARRRAAEIAGLPCDRCFFGTPAVPAEPTRREAVKVVAKVATKDAKHVGAAIRDGLLFEAASHACAALLGVGLWPLVEHAGHIVLGWVAS